MINSIEHRLRIKYGLMEYPSPEQASEWRKRAKARIANGEDPERAAREAAWEVFGELDRIALFSEADTIETLLARASSKDQTDPNELSQQRAGRSNPKADEE